MLIIINLSVTLLQCPQGGGGYLPRSVDTLSEYLHLRSLRLTPGVTAPSTQRQN